MKMVYHGGSCCGMKHIYGFTCNPDSAAYFEPGSLYAPKGGMTNKEFLTYLCEKNKRRCTEVILTSAQIRFGWLPILQELGFELVSRFKNANSGCICNVFHLREQSGTRLKGWRN